MVNVRVNGQERTFDGDPSMPLHVVPARRARPDRHEIRLRRRAVRRLHRASQRRGRALLRHRRCRTSAARRSITIEGLDPKGEHPVQVAWRELGVPQCGYCQTGQIMQAAALLAKKPAPDRRGDHRRHGRQHLPLRLLPAHPCGRARRREGGVT